MRFRVIFTLDYEIHGNGHGLPRKLMVEPTDRLIAQFNSFGAKLTIMADVAEILRFKRYRDETGSDYFEYESIQSQLIRAVQSGHDVQLHLHPSYYNSRFIDGYLEQDFTEYDLAALPYQRLNQIVKEGKKWLEEILVPAEPTYGCIAFRAANWCMNPAQGIVKALVDNDIAIDTSVFKYGARSGMVSFDYSAAPSDLVPWPVSSGNICQRDKHGTLFEVPIYCERRPLWAFLTLNRVYRAIVGKLNPLPKEKGGRPTNLSNERPKNRVLRSIGLRKLWDLLLGKHAWKLDFNQCTGKQLTAAARRIEKRYGRTGGELPIVLIGHSKLFTAANERSLESFLRFVADNSQVFTFGSFRDLSLDRFASEEPGQ